MARNQEKQLGRLNRLWLEKERQDGHLKDGCCKRPRLSTINSAAEVKKWIPSIKKEIEYFLEQSQLSHYSERKIKEFEEHIKHLKKDYQSHLWKLRRLDPSCKEHPWKLRGYTRKRPVDAKVPSGNEAAHPTCAKLLCTPVLLKDVKQLDIAYTQKEVDAPYSSEEAKSSSTLYDGTNVDMEAQDQPLSFRKKINPKELWESSSYNILGEDVLKMKDILLSHHLSSPGKTLMPLHGNKEAQNPKSRDSVNNLLGLDCYSASSSEDDDT